MPAPACDTGGGDPRLSDRPYPGGGACYELELYVTVGRCEGIAPAVYHYDPLGHRLELVNSDRAVVDELLDSAGQIAVMDVPPPVLITMTARFRRLTWKYEGMAYAVALMNVGVLIQSLYLVCTAMAWPPARSAACARRDGARRSAPTGGSSRPWDSPRAASSTRTAATQAGGSRSTTPTGRRPGVAHRTPQS